MTIAFPILLLGLPVRAEPFYEAELLFPLQEKHVHSSSLIECPNGDLLACWFHGSGEREAPDVQIQGARRKNGSKTWSPVFPMADTPNLPDCNPVLFIDQKEELRLFWIAVLANRWEDSLLRYKISPDYQGDGAPQWRWQDVIILKPGEEFARDLESGYNRMNVPEIDYGGYAPHPLEALVEAARNASNRQKGWMTRTHAIALPSGRILLPLYSDGFYVGLMAISDDEGATWRPSAPLVGIGLNQPSVVCKKNGGLVAYMRDEGPAPKRVQVSESQDDGETWLVAVETDIPNPDSSLEVIALRDSRWIMAFNDCEEGRDRLALALSDDEGKTWKWKRYLEDLRGGLFHYPSLVQTRDGRIHLSYTYQPGEHANKSIKHAALDADWIMQGK